MMAMGRLGLLSPSFYNEALRSFNVDCVTVSPTGFECKDDDREEAIRSLLVALGMAYVERSRWNGCTGSFGPDGTITHQEGESCPLHGAS